MITYQVVSPLYKAVWDLGLSNRVTIECLENNTVIIRMSSSGDSIQHAITLCELTSMQEGVAQKIIKNMVTQLSRSKTVSYMERYSTRGSQLKSM